MSIGHAIIDVLGHADDAFLGEFSLVKGSMELIEGDRAVPLYEAMAASAARQNEQLLTQSREDRFRGSGPGGRRRTSARPVHVQAAASSPIQKEDTTMGRTLRCVRTAVKPSA